MSKPIKKSLTKEQLINIQSAIVQMSNVNQQSGFNIYDLGFRANSLLARTLNSIKPVMKELSEEEQAFMEKGNELLRDRDNALKAATTEEERQSVEDAFGRSASRDSFPTGKFKELQREREQTLKEEIEVTIHPIKWQDIKFNGQAPTPQLFSWLEPIIEYPEEKEDKHAS